MYRRNTSSGSNATRSCRRLATRLVGPALMSSVAERSIASSSASGARTSSAIIRPSGESAAKSRLKKIAWRVGGAPPYHGRREVAGAPAPAPLPAGGGGGGGGAGGPPAGARGGRGGRRRPGAGAGPGRRGGCPLGAGGG